MKIRWKAQNSKDTQAYYHEPYTVQHFTDWLAQILTAVWDLFRYMTSKKKRLEHARLYNSLMFGNIPTSQIYVSDRDGVRPLREEERTWPE